MSALEVGESPTLMKDTEVLLFYALAFVTSLFFSVDGFVMEEGESRYPLPSRIVVGSKMFSLSKQRGTMTKYHLEIFS